MDESLAPTNRRRWASVSDPFYTGAGPRTKSLRSFATNLSDPGICEDFQDFLKTLDPELRERYQVEHFAAQEDAVPTHASKYTLTAKRKKRSRKHKHRLIDGPKRTRRTSYDIHGIPKQYENALASKSTCYKKLRSQFLVSGSHFIQAGVVRGILGVYQSRFQHLTSFPSIIHPYSNFIWFWNMFVCILLGVSLVGEPYIISFRSELLGSPYYLTASTTVSLILCLDMLLKLRVGYKDPVTAEIVLEPSLIALNYFKFRFWYNLITRFPYDTIAILAIPPASRQVKTQLTAVRISMFVLKLLRYEKMNRFLRDMTVSLNFRNWNTQVFLHGILILHYFHWGACAEFLVPDIANAYEIEAGRPHKPTSWLTTQNLWDEHPGMQYLRSFIKALAIVLSLDGGAAPPDETEEIFLVFLMIILSITAVAYFISTFSTMPLTEHATNAKYNEIVTSVNQYLKFRKIPNWLCERVMAYYAAKYKGKSFPEDELFKTLPHFLKNEILLHNCSHILESIYLFKSIPWPIIQNLVQRFKPEVYIPGDVILSPYTQRKRCMYFIDEGVFGVFTDYGQCIKLIERGGLFGEVDFLFPDVQRRTTIICLAISNVYILTKEEYAKAVRYSPEINDTIREMASAKFIEEMKQLEKQSNNLNQDKVMTSKTTEEYYADMENGRLPQIHNMLPDALEKIIDQIGRRSVDAGLVPDKFQLKKDVP